MPDIKKIAKGAAKVAKGAARKVGIASKETKLRQHLGKGAAGKKEKRSLTSPLMPALKRSLAGAKVHDRLDEAAAAAKRRKALRSSKTSLSKTRAIRDRLRSDLPTRKITNADVVDFLREGGAQRRGLGKAMKAKQERKRGGI